jgi:uncharacterized protein (UPF0261 family)
MSKAGQRSPTVVLVGTLDTKGKEYAYLRERICERGVDVLLIDAGILGEPLTDPDVTRQEVARAAGADVQALADARDRGAAIETMARGAALMVSRLHGESRFDAIGALGGSGGSALATYAMRQLPAGVPKLMVSTVASGDTSGYVGAVDITMMYSVVDVAGLNQSLMGILCNAAGALVGMATATVPVVEARPLIVASMLGITTPCVTTARERLEELGYEVLVFHQTGVGGRSMEEVMKAGLVVGVLDVTTTELADELGGGVWPAGPERLEVAARLGIPQVVSLGGLDMICFSPPAPLPERFRGRQIYVHNDVMAGARTSPQECREIAVVIALKLNAATGPTALFLPLRGVSVMATEGQLFHDVEADGALFSGLRELVDRSKVEVREVDADINDPQFALALAHRLHELVSE